MRSMVLHDLRTALIAVLSVILISCDTSVEKVMPERNLEQQTVLSLDKILAGSAMRGGYVPPTLGEVERSEELFGRILRGERTDAVDLDLAELGFRRRAILLGDVPLTFIEEAPGRRTGKGIFILRDSPDKSPDVLPVMLQAPHRFHDLDTGAITARLFEEGIQQGAFEAAAWNTAPRSYEEDGRRIHADLAHISVTHFNAFTRAFATVHPQSRVAQIHGYEVTRRRTDTARESMAIISAGVQEPTPHARHVAHCMADVLHPEPVLLFPEDTRALGATTNVNAAALRELGHQGFVHVELSRSLRARLVNDWELREQLVPCLTGAHNRGVD